MGRIIKEAFYIARTGRPGPVLIDLPKDVMGELGSPDYPDTVNIRGYKPNTSVHMGQLKRALKMLKKAKKTSVPCRGRREYRTREQNIYRGGQQDKCAGW